MIKTKDMPEDTTEEITTVQNVPHSRVVRTTRKVRPVETEHPQERYETKKVIFRTYQFIWYTLGVIETLLIFRILLKALAANPASDFVSFIYAVSDLFALPFVGMFRIIVEGESVFEIGTFVGCLVYLVVAYGIVQLFQLIKPTSPEEVEQNV